jgi:hypothetical protein
MTGIRGSRAASTEVPKGEARVNGLFLSGPRLLLLQVSTKQK